MAEQKLEDADNPQAPGGEGGQSVYLGNSVPKFLRVIYVAFIVWAVVYLSKFLVPDLLKWLKK